MKSLPPTVRILRSALAAVSLLACLATARADDAAAVPVDDANTVSLKLGAFLVTDINTTLSLRTASGGGGTLIDFGDTLGGETSADIFRFDANWTIKGPHHLLGSWYDINLDGRRVIDREIEWGDQTYPINATIDSSFDTSIYKLSYGYTFRRGQMHEYSALIGVHVMRLGTRLSVSGGSTAASTEGFEVTAPLPALGLGWTAHWTDRFQTQAIIQYFGISVDDKIEGHFMDFLVSAEYQVSKHFSVGAGFNRFDIDVDATRGPLTLSLENTYNGFLLYIGANF
jgi:hypothetical protein